MIGFVWPAVLSLLKEHLLKDECQNKNNLAKQRLVAHGLYS